MASPDDPLFWMHHANIDRIWAMWQDCYDYDKATTITDTIFPASWNITKKTDSKTVTLDDPMPYMWQSLNPADTATRFKPVPTPRQILSMGTATTPGFNGIYYRYVAPDGLVQTLETSFPGTCNIDTLVDYSSTSKRQLVKPPRYIFNSPKLQAQFDRINKLWPRRTTKQKLRYLALYECAKQSRPLFANGTEMNLYETPSAWLEMNGQSDWRTICQIAGQEDGYENLAFLEDSQDSILPTSTSNILIIVFSIVGVLLIVGIIGGLYYFRTQASQTEVLNVQGTLREPMMDSRS